MIIPFYILGLLQRFGPQHGYQIKKIISEQLADFTQIKLPVIYYHLEKMTQDELILPDCEKDGNRPEKTVYSVTDKGKKKFLQMLGQLQEFDYRPVFEADGVFYFSEYLDSGQVSKKLRAYGEKLTNSIQAIEKHRNESMAFIPEEFRSSADIIFEHHLLHYRAEQAWVEKSISILEEKK